MASSLGPTHKIKLFVCRVRDVLPTLPGSLYLQRDFSVQLCSESEATSLLVANHLGRRVEAS